MRHRQSHCPKFLLDLPPKDEGSLIEEYMAALPIYIGEQHRLDQAVSIIESGKLHRLFGPRMHRLGCGEHSGCQNVLTDVAG